ncbi:MAG: CRISPR-associated endonuclease Cas2 [Pseudomonadota bacterium]
MAVNQKKNWLIAYDIAHPRRLARIHRRLVKYALPVQYSLFLYNGSTQQVSDLLDELALLMEVREDDLRAYPLPTQTEIHALGQSGLPDSMILHDQNFGDMLSVIKYR